jgi:hypothetical protein
LPVRFGLKVVLRMPRPLPTGTLPGVTALLEVSLACGILAELAIAVMREGTLRKKNPAQTSKR